MLDVLSKNSIPILPSLPSAFTPSALFVIPKVMPKQNAPNLGAFWWLWDYDLDDFNTFLNKDMGILIIAIPIGIITLRSFSISIVFDKST